jgi:hypothetical protein
MPNYPSLDLRGKFPKDTFQNFVQNSASIVVDGYGDSVDTLNVTASVANALSVVPITAVSASYATSASYAVNGGSGGSGGTTLVTGSTYPITASVAVTASYAPQIPFPNTIASASWVSASARITTADTSSYVLASNVSGKVSTSTTADTASYISVANLPPHTASWATTAVTANAISFVPGLATSATSASYSSRSLSASYAPVEPSYSASVSTVKQNTLTNTLYVITASFATSASYALMANTASYSEFIYTNITQSVTYTTASNWASSSASSSWASSSWSSSYAPVQPSYSSSVSAALGTKQDTLTNILYVITASNSTSASYSLTASYAPFTPFTSGSVTAFAYNALYLDNGIIFKSKSTGSDEYVNPQINLRGESGIYNPGNTMASIRFQNNTNTTSASIEYKENNTLVINASRIIATVDTSSHALNAKTASYALNGGSGGTTLVTASTYPITSSWATNVVNGSTATYTSSLYGTASWALRTVSSSYTTQSIIQTTSSYADFAPVLFNNVRIINGDLIIRSSDTGNWFKLDVFDDGDGNFTTQRTTATGTGSIFNSSSMYTGMFVTNSLSSSWASSSLSSSYTLTASYALNGGSGGSTLVTGSTYPITSSWALRTVSSSYITQSVITSSYADFAPVLFSNVRIINGDLIIRSSDTGNWYALSVFDDGSGSFTTQLSQSTATGSIFNSSSMATSMFATNSLSSSYALTASYAANGGSSGVSSSYATTASYATFAAAYFSQSADLSMYWYPSGSDAKGQIGFVNTASNIFVVSQQSSSAGGLSLNTSGSQRIFITPQGQIQLSGSVVYSGSLSASYALTASYASNGGGSSLTTGSTYPITASWAINTISQSASSVMLWVPSGSIPLGSIGFSSTSSTDFVISQQSSSVGGISLQTSCSQRVYITTAGGIQLSGSVTISGSLSASYALTASYAANGSSVSSSYALTSSFATFAASYFSQSADLNMYWYPDNATAKGQIGFANTASNTFVISQQSSSVGGLSLNTSGSQRIFITPTGNIQLSGSITTTGSFYQTDYIQLVHPSVFSISASVYTGSTSPLYGHAVFGAGTDSGSNYVEYLLTVPYNIDTTKALRGNIKYSLISTDTASYSHKLSMASVSDDGLLTTVPIINEVTFTTITTGSAGSVKSTGWSTLTSWSGSLTAGNLWKVRLARVSGSNLSISSSADVSVNIEYGKI